MRTAIISDLHANREALEAVFAHVRAQGVDDLVCLGDVVGYGPDPDFCVDLVRGHARFCLMGNHDEALFRDAYDFNSYARGAIEYTRALMQPRWYSSSEKKARWRWLQSLPQTVTEGRCLYVHGSPRDPVREYVLATDGLLNPDKLRAILASFDGVIFAGHTHHPGLFGEDLRFHGLGGLAEVHMELEPGKRYFVNVGSTGQPRDGDPRACYAVLGEQRVSWYRVPYDLRATQEKIHRTGALHEVLARRLAIGR